MARHSEPPEDPVALLERVAARLEDELAGWRRRSFKAEAEAEDARGRATPVSSGDLTLIRQRVSDLEAENQRLRARVAEAREQVEQLRTRLRFVGDQAQGDRR